MAGAAGASQGTRADADAERRQQRYGQLPQPLDVAELVESEPEVPPPEPAYDPNFDAIRWFGGPL